MSNEINLVETDNFVPPVCTEERNTSLPGFMPYIVVRLFLRDPALHTTFINLC